MAEAFYLAYSFQDCRDDRTTPVQVQFTAIFPRKTCRTGKESRQAMVEQFAIGTLDRAETRNARCRQ